MTSPAQLAANRRNAQKSTGPKTAEGKAAASRNALRHGFTARETVCHEERESDYAAFEAEMRETLAPADATEAQLIECIIHCAWRLRRIPCAEHGLIHHGSNRHQRQFSRAFERSSQEMLALSRYETTLDRALGRAYAMLERRQAARRGLPVPPPFTVPVEGVDSDAANPLQARQKSQNYETKPILAATPPGDASR